MRNAFRDEILELAQHDARIVLLSADIGNRMFDAFKAAFPDRFYNLGIAEQNVIGLAAGLAMAGLRPICYTIANFITYRVLEQIRIDCCYHHQPVIIAGVGGGLSYASLGATHHSCEDIAALRALPEMAVLCPGDAMEVRAGVRAALARDDGPTYLRLGKKNEPVLHAAVPGLALGQSLRLQEGDDVTLLSCGNVLPVVLDAARLLEAGGLSVRVESCVSVKPLPEATLRAAFDQTQLVVAVEEHGRIGGFSAAVAEWLADRDAPPPAALLRLGTPDAFLHRTGSQDYARTITGLTSQRIAQAVTARLARAAGL